MTTDELDTARYERLCQYLCDVSAPDHAFSDAEYFRRELKETREAASTKAIQEALEKLGMAISIQSEEPEKHPSHIFVCKAHKILIEHLRDNGLLNEGAPEGAGEGG